MTMLLKRGCRADPANYRGIALVNCTAKIFTYIIRLRLEAWVEKRGIIPECQAVLRKKRCCADNVFAMQAEIQLQLRLPFILPRYTAFSSILSVRSTL